ncbi:hypothetical protein [Kibdelosporangium philippinense]|uniref:hypothetical protein n=1 Tax=Kibdelosporangium philippinense TaxID=211113 RepID=UPI0036179BFC
MGTTNLIAQNSVERHDLGVATSTATFARSIGGSLGVAVLGSIFSSRITDSMTSALGSAGTQFTSGGGQLSPKMIEGLPAPVRDAYLGGMVSGFRASSCGRGVHRDRFRGLVVRQIRATARLHRGVIVH